jgi:hypothetical protein
MTFVVNPFDGNINAFSPHSRNNPSGNRGSVMTRFSACSRDGQPGFRLVNRGKLRSLIAME